MKKGKSAATCRPDEIHKLTRDNRNAGDFWMLCDGREVTIAEQPLGEQPKQTLSIPRKFFNRLLRGYTRVSK